MTREPLDLIAVALVFLHWVHLLARANGPRLSCGLITGLALNWLRENILKYRRVGASALALLEKAMLLSPVWGS
jgi:hypothetical protein